jgi:hypothetical protein
LVIRSQHLALLFLAVVVPPIVALIWLGVQLVDQDRALWAQREEERRQTAARAAVLSLDQALTEAEQRFGEGPPAAGVVRFGMSSRVVLAEPANGVLWLPVTAPLSPADASHSWNRRPWNIAARETPHGRPMKLSRVRRRSRCARGLCCGWHGWLGRSIG